MYQPTTNILLDAAKDMLVTFNVNGELFTTYSSTILESESTVLSNLLFRDIMFYLRTGQIYTKDIKKLAALTQEATYYEMTTMKDALQASMEDAAAARIQQKKEQAQKETNGREMTYSVLDIVYVKDINNCFEHRKSYCACSATPKFVLIPNSSGRHQQE
ncbi:hypothetical protein MUCCIDRAFT_116264 [Mucor lusitanicus CBS 277.49]|uniref:BTB domain-containing protein n=1 Tax=Mucor lusitanicus CBS 277.49 TaxID=747725 RepID=A0A168GEA1_MUCCL|nr:hypothetical protein MUCCIDRAFT_116264 [Mucor lusitanicus CBS 277.49]